MLHQFPNQVLRFGIAAGYVLISASLVAAVETESSQPLPAKTHAVKPLKHFLEANCLDCHDGAGGEGGFDIAMLNAGIDNAETYKRWVRALDRVRDGEMPPPEDMEIDVEQRHQFVRRTHQWLSEFQRREDSKYGRVRGRRLTAQQVERTLCDLLKVDLPLADLVPPDPRPSGFAETAAGQQMSHFQLQSHLTLVDAALDASWQRLFENQPVHLALPAERIANKPKNKRNRDPELLDGAAVGWNSRMPFYPRISNSKVKQAGWYDIELNASALNMPDAGQPGSKGLWCSVRSGAMTSSAPLMFWVGQFELHEAPETFRFRAYVQADHLLEVRINDVRLKRAKFAGGQVGNGEGTPQNVPGIAMHHLGLRQVFPGGDRETVIERWFGDAPVKIDAKREQVQYVGDNPQADFRPLIQRFVALAFRRPGDAAADRYGDFFDAQLDASGDPVAALRAMYRAILCSPRFLYFKESPGRLDDHALADRISYFLTGTSPDAELRDLADRGELSDPEVIRKTIHRLLADDGTERFVERFAKQWLDLIDIDFTTPEPRLHPDFDPIVQQSMLDETRLFLTDLFRRDAPVRELVDSRHTFLNRRLAEYYRVPGLAGEAMRRTRLPADSPRGGLLAQGSVLKVTAAGNETSPVVRGVWISERILGQEIPAPPENVPAVEPDVRGATTIREQLEKHQDDANCAACHRMIDPPGYALENFDAAGRWRDYYPRLKGRRILDGAEIDASFRMPDGREFADFQEFKRCVADRPEKLAENLAAKLLVYGTGEEIRYSDRAALREIVRDLSERQYPIKEILCRVVLSDCFGSK
ncbi:MAG: DUF1592 domain-containing protein [Planctomycetota bacterium]